MKVQLVHTVEFTAGAGAGVIRATPRVTTEDGEVISEGEAIDVKAGQSMHYGPFPVHVDVAGDFHNGPTPAAGPSEQAGAPSQAKPAQTPTHGRR